MFNGCGSESRVINNTERFLLAILKCHPGSCMADTLRSWTCTMFYEMKTWQFAQDQVQMDGDYQFSEDYWGSWIHTGCTMRAMFPDKLFHPSRHHPIQPSDKQLVAFSLCRRPVGGLADLASGLASALTTCTASRLYKTKSLEWSWHLRNFVNYCILVYLQIIGV